MIYVAAFPERYLNPMSEIDNGHCARLVQIATGAPQAKFWRRGEKVRGNQRIAYGTAIAIFQLGGTFDEAAISGYVRYTNLADLTAHAALYVRQDANGITVIDQWKGRGKVAFSTYSFTPKLYPIHDGNNYYIIEAPPYLTQSVLPDRSEGV